MLSADATFPQTLFFGPFAKLSEFARLRVRANDRLALIQIGKCEKRRMTEASIESDGIDVFVVYNGVRIAKRGDPDIPKLVFGFRQNPATECLTRITLQNWPLSAKGLS